MRLRSIRDQVLVPSIGLMFLGLVAIGGFAAWSRADSETKTFLNKLGLTVELTRSGASSSLWGFDQNMAASTLAPATEDPEFKAGIIFDDTGKVFYAIGDQSIVRRLSSGHTQDLPARFIVKTAPLMHTDNGREFTIGQLMMVFDNYAMTASGHRAAFAMAGLAFATLLIAGSTLILILNRMINPIVHFSQIMRAMADRDFSRAVPGRDRCDEIGRMADALEVFRARMVQAEALAARHAEEVVKREHLTLLANTDPLTGTFNRRAFMARLYQLVRVNVEMGSEIACFMIDIDHFKRINDTFGHVVGDKVIAGMAETLKTVLRNTDLIGRYGGEEFCVVLPGTSQVLAEELANRVREVLSRRSHEWFDEPYEVTASIGIAMFAGELPEPNEVINRADEALYAAKTSGRNRVVCWKSSAECGTEPTPSEAQADVACASCSSVVADDAAPIMAAEEGDLLNLDVSKTDELDLSCVIDTCVASLEDKVLEAGPTTWSDDPAVTRRLTTDNTPKIAV